MSTPVLDEMIRRMRSLGDGTFAAECAREAAPAMAAEIKRTAAAGTSPDGAAWPEKKGGGRALAKAAGEVTARAVDDVAAVSIPFPYSLHNAGQGHAPKRQILPETGAGIPPRMAEVCSEAAQRVWARRMGGAR